MVLIFVRLDFGSGDFYMVRGNLVLMQYKARQFIDIIADAGRIADFDIDLYCVFVEKMTVHSEKRLTIHLLDGTAVACEKE